MDPLAARVLRTIRRHGLLPARTRVLVALSGGSDSVALLHLLLALQERGEYGVAGVAHVHHGLRGPAADADAAFCAEVAVTLALPFHVEHVDAAARARRERRSVEDAARTERYEALERAAAVCGASRIAVGHTRDDQAETVLLKLLRGAGTSGLAGIHPQRGPIVRPLLDAGRDELRGWLRARGVAFVEDETNADLRLSRNAVRHKLMPVLCARFGPSVPAVLARHAEVAREDDLALAEWTASWFAQCVRADGPVRIDWTALEGAPTAIQRRVVRAALIRAGAREPGLEHVLRVASLARGDSGAVELPGAITARRAGDELVFAGPAGPEVDAQGFTYQLSIPGSVWIAETKRTVAARWADPADPEVLRQLTGGRNRSTAVVAGDRLEGLLTVRSWRPGDALRPLGVGGRKKVQDVFVDRKVPGPARRRVPLVVDSEGRIVWVTGHAIDEAYRVTEATRAVVVLTMRESGGWE